MTHVCSMKDELNLILKREALTIVFQAIFDTSSDKVMGYEALSRGPKNHPLRSPQKLFDLAYEHGKLSELERLCRKLAIKAFSERKLEGSLFLNISPLVLSQKDHTKGETAALLLEYGLSPEQVVIEVTEQYDAGDTNYLKEGLEYYRKLGFIIAIDDLGTGHSGLKQWAEIRPDIVKIDRYFISDCHTNIVKRELLRTIFELGKATQVKIIAEGIEKAEEFRLLKSLGMRFAQGFLLGRPSVLPLNHYKGIDLELVDRPIRACASAAEGAASNPQKSRVTPVFS